jgi:hypothetical protein
MTDLNGPQIASVVKSGETHIWVMLSRSGRKQGDPADWKGGTRVTVRATTRVEEFMQNLGAGEVVDVATIGRYWQPIGGIPLNAYVTQPFNPHFQIDDGSFITLDRLGHPLILPSPDGQQDRHSTVNLSFLRLRGISEGLGVTFGIKGVYSLDELRKVKDRISAASRRFYVDYLRPVDLLVTVSTQEVQL